MSKQAFSKDDYNNRFIRPEPIRKKALEIVLDIRKFEIELYWKRATYFWTFIAASLAGFGAIQASSSPIKTDLSVFLSCLGLVFSVGWLCVNRGSKYWQENWENHLDMLEDDECGPIYKVVLNRMPPANFQEKFEHILNGPSPISVSKTNQIISLYVCLLWCFLLFYSLPEFSTNAPVNWYYVVAISITLITCILFFTKFAATWDKGHTYSATIRTSTIAKESQQTAPVRPR